MREVNIRTNKRVTQVILLLKSLSYGNATFGAKIMKT